MLNLCKVIMVIRLGFIKKMIALLVIFTLFAIASNAMISPPPGGPGSGFAESIEKVGVNDSNKSFNATMINDSEKLIEGNQTNETTYETLNASSNSTL
jgi:hypothetical protein